MNPEPAIWIIAVTANPVEGIKFIGPFDSAGDATEHALECINDYWWVTRVSRP